MPEISQSQLGFHPLSPSHPQPVAPCLHLLHFAFRGTVEHSCREMLRGESGYNECSQLHSVNKVYIKKREREGETCFFRL